MGVVERSSNGVYYRLKDGKLVRRFKQNPEDPKAVASRTDDGALVWDRFYDSYEGYLVKIESRDSTYKGETSRQYMFYFQDERTGGEVGIITMQHDSAYFRYIVNALSSLEDFSKKILISPWKMQDREKPEKYYLGLTVYLPPYGKADKVPLAIEWKDERIPALRKYEGKGGKTEYDNTEQTKFWERVLEKKIMPKIATASGDRLMRSLDEDRGPVEESPKQDPSPKQRVASDDIDDVPF